MFINLIDIIIYYLRDILWMLEHNSIEWKCLSIIVGNGFRFYKKQKQESPC